MRAASSLLLAWLLASTGTLAQPVSPPVRTASGDELILSSELHVRVQRGRNIELRVRPREGDDYASIAARLTGSVALAEALAAWNGEVRVDRLPFVRVPLPLLSKEYRRLVLGSLFPADRRRGDDWVHVARSGVLAVYDEGLWQIAEWFAGQGSRFPELLAANRMLTPEVAPGQEVRIPGSLLHPAFRARKTSDDGTLEYDEDPLGPYAAYRLKVGETLYSSVVLRFTGRTSADDVNALAQELATRSGITDPTDIPVGFAVKVPFDVLEAEFLPRDHPVRRDAEVARVEMAAELAREPVAETRGGLEGVVIVLDPGHGGRDLGTMNHGIWEHDYVYDVACRLKGLLETRTAATVRLTLEDVESGCIPADAEVLPANHQGTVQTHPPFLAREIGESGMGVNLRWYLANSMYRAALRRGVDPGRIVFVSLHADARHPTLRGAMVYVPGAAYRGGTHGFDDAAYRRYQEVREKPRVRFSRRDLVRSEAVSRKLAAAIIGALRVSGLGVQPEKPIRDRVIRGRATWLPAVLRGNEIPAKVLLELVNLNNPQDAGVLRAAGDRERLATAIADGLLGYFGEGSRRREGHAGPR